MNTNVVPMPQVAREIDLNGSQLSLIRRTLAADTTEDEFNLFIEVARRVKADPFRKHIYALVFSKDDPKKRRMSIVTGIDFYRTTAARNRDYRPDDRAPHIQMNEALKSSSNPLGIEFCEVKGFKFGPDGNWHAVVGVAYWEEYVPLEEVCDKGWEWVETGERWEDSNKPKKKRVPKGDVRMVPKGKWGSMGRTMISKCAEALMLRKGWPEDLSGVYVDEEMDRAKAEDFTASEMAERAVQEKRLIIAGAVDAITIMWAPGVPLENVPVGKFADRAMEWLRTATSATEVEGWRDTNRMPLREFWARAKSDGLELNKAIENRLKELTA